VTPVDGRREPRWLSTLDTSARDRRTCCRRILRGCRPRGTNRRRDLDRREEVAIGRGTAACRRRRSDGRERSYRARSIGRYWQTRRLCGVHRSKSKPATPIESGMSGRVAQRESARFTRESEPSRESQKHWYRVQMRGFRARRPYPGGPRHTPYLAVGGSRSVLSAAFEALRLVLCGNGRAPGDPAASAGPPGPLGTPLRDGLELFVRFQFFSAEDRGKTARGNVPIAAANPGRGHGSVSGAAAH